MMKRIFVICLALLMLLSVTGCGKHEEKYTDGELAGGTLTGEGGARLFAPELVAVPDIGFHMIDAVKAANEISVCATDDNGHYRFYRIRLSDHSISRIEGLELDNVISMDGAGWGVTFILSMNEDGSYQFYSFSNEGVGNLDKPYHSFPLNLPDGLSLDTIWEAVVLKDGTVLRANDSVYYVIAGGGATAFGPYSGQISLIRNTDDSVFVVEQDNGIIHAQLLGKDPSGNTLELQELASYSIEGSYPVLCGGMEEGELFAWNSDVLYELDMTSGTSWAFANTYASGGKAACLIPLSEGSYFGAAYDGEPAFWSIKKSENVQVIRLATCSGVDFNGDQILRNAVSSFNALSPDYRIELIDYGVYNEGYDVNVGMTRLNADISAGNEPDIYDLWSLSSANSYISKGLIADLKPWFEKDAEISYGDMIPSAAAALEKDGHLYDLVPCFTVTTVFSSDERIGQARHLTVSEFLDLAEQVGAEQMFGAGMTREGFLTRLISYTGTEYVDRVHGTCSFDSPDFIRLLRYVAQLPEEKDQALGDWERIYYGEQDLYCTGSGNLIRWICYADSVFGGESRSIGFPATNGNGVAMTPSIRLGMSANSEVQEGVWAFFKYLLSDSFQYKVGDVPMMQRALDRVMEKWISEMDGEKALGLVGVKDGQHFNTTIPLAAPDETTKVRAIQIIQSIDCVNEYDSYLFDIIWQEFSAYVNGGKTAEQAAAAIQSRASVYLSEQYG